MARPLRILYEQAYYHVMNRGRNRVSIFKDDYDYHSFLSLLKESCNLFNVKILSYCLMTNHYHLLISTPEANLPRAMRHINGVYTQKFNRRYKKDGTLFKGRYKAILIEKEDYLFKLICYVHLNPVKAGIVNNPNQYPWSSHRNYLKAKDIEDWLCARFGLSHISENIPEAVECYKSLISQGIDPEVETFYSKQKLSPIFGSKSFQEKMQNSKIDNNLKSILEVPEKRQLIGKRMIDNIISVVSQAYRVSRESLYASNRGKVNLPRQMAIALARDLSGLNHQQIAGYFSIGSDRTVSKQYQRLMHKHNKDVRNTYERLKETCRQVGT